MKKRNKIAKDLFTTKYRKRVVKPKKGKGSYKRKKRGYPRFGSNTCWGGPRKPGICEK